MSVSTYAFTAALLALYAESCTEGTSPATEPHTTKSPDLRASIAGSVARATCTVPMMLMSITRCTRTTSSCIAGDAGMIAAVCITRSIGPRSAMIAAVTRSTSAKRVTSQTYVRTLLRPAAVSRMPASLTSQRATSAP